MNRRKFLQKTTVSGVAIATSPFLIIKPSRKDGMSRIGLTTVVFRNRFNATKPKDMVLKDELTLLDIPEYFADRFGIHNVEFWANHFESTSAAYLNDIKKALKKHKSSLIDIQAESGYDLSDPNQENRQKGIADMKAWIDVGATLGSQFIRIGAMKKSYEKSVESVKTITEYAQSKGIKALVENHFDLFSDPKHHVNIIKDVSNENLGLLADFGNYPASVARYDVLQKIAPYTKLVSAKTSDFDDNMNHTSYDFEKCVDLFEEAGYQGIYSLEQWGKFNPAYDYEKITDWMIAKVKGQLAI